MKETLIKSAFTYDNSNTEDDIKMNVNGQYNGTFL